MYTVVNEIYIEYTFLVTCFFFKILVNIEMFNIESYENRKNSM